MKKNKNISIILLAILLTVGCETFVTDIDAPIDVVPDPTLDTESLIPFLILGVQTRFAHTIDNVFVAADGLSDQIVFSLDVPEATYTSFEDIELGDIRFDNAEAIGIEANMGELRFMADNLIERTNKITFTNNANREKALFIGNFYGGIARYLYATYIGLTENEGGGAIDAGPFIPSADMYALAITKFNQARTHTTDADEIKAINFMLTKIYLYLADYPAAAATVVNSFVNGDLPFTSKYLASSSWNYYYTHANWRTQWVLDDRFITYIAQDFAEANRIAYSVITGKPPVERDYYIQNKYSTAESPISFMSWQENNLMRAELILRGFGTGDELALVNEVRASHNLDPVASIILINAADPNDPAVPSIYIERDKELMCQGVRLPDQRRFNRWTHLPADAWRFLPITERERDANPNL